MIKLPWDKDKQSLKNRKEEVEKDEFNSSKDDLEKNTVDEPDKYIENNALLKTKEKTFNYSDLPEECKKLVDEIKTADLQIQITKDTISMIQPTRNKILNDLKEKLESFDAIDA